MQDHILITGGSGFIGQALVDDWLAQGHQVTVLSRRPGWVERRWQGRVAATDDVHTLRDHFSVLVNLAGEGIADQRWSQQRKRQLYESRVDLTRELVSWAQDSGQCFRVVLSGSAIGWYGGFDGSDSQPLSEQAPGGQDYAAQLCQDWELAAADLASMSERLVLLRTGIVLGRHGGMLKRLWLPFRIGLGGIIGDGEQVLSWIHLSDYRKAVHWLLGSEIEGPVNMTAPMPVSNREFTESLAAAMKRPALMPMPALIARILFGEMSCLLLQGQWVVPGVLQSHQFQFDYPDIQAALAIETGR